MNTDHPNEGGGRIALVAHDDIVNALDDLAAVNGETRSHLARRIIAAHLQAAGVLAPRSPMTPRAGKRRTRTL